MTAKHTQGELTVDYDAMSNVYWLADEAQTTVCDLYFKTQSEDLIPFVNDEANAARLALCWNMHDRLVAMLRKLDAERNTAEKGSRALGHDETGPWEDYSEIPDAALDEVHALLADIDGAKCP